MDASRFLRGLDEAQRHAVVDSTSPLAILAPAGSGKTRVLTSRIGYQSAIGVIDPRRTLALTFTRRAAEELRTRLRTMGIRDSTTAGTFHAIAYAQLRAQWADRNVRAPGLLDDRARFVRRHFSSELRGDEVARVVSEIDWAKARLVRPERYVDDATMAGRSPGMALDRVAGLYRRYEDTKQERRVVDFDDLLRLVIAEMDRDQSYAEAVRWRHQHLFVDEFQDVNPLQFRLLESWMGERSDLCVVGDPNQAIYAWNGADAGFLTDFEDLFPNARVARLDRNYRSTRQILTVAVAVLDDTDLPSPPPTHRDGGLVPDLITYETALDESRGIARALRDRHLAGRSWSQQAVLCRTRRQLLDLADDLRAARIPHRVRRTGLSSDPAIKAILADLRHSPTFEQFLADLAAPDLDDSDLDSDTAEQDDDAAAFDRTPPAGDADNADGATGGDTSLTPADARRLLTNLGEDFAELDDRASVPRFVDWLKTAEDPGGWGNQVTVATFHAAKGLEWPVVHVAGLEAGFCPIHHAQTPEAEAEERRLVYVAFTRATDELVCSWARTRSFGSRTSDRQPSPYLARVERARTLLRRQDRPAPPPPELSAERAASQTEADDASEATAARRAHLDAWRVRMARGVRVEPQAVIDDVLLELISTANPSSLDELGDLDGLGPVRLHELGPEILGALAQLER